VLWALVVLPFYAVARVVTGGTEAGTAGVVGRLLTGMYDPLLYALCAVLLFSLCLRLCDSRPRAWGIVILWTFATMTWGTSKHSSYLSLISCLLLGILWFLVPPQPVRPRGAFFAAGVCFGLMVLTRSQEGVLLPACALYAFVRVRRLPLELRQGAAVSFGVPVVLALGGLALLNLHKFGADHPFGYTYQPVGPLYVGLWGLLVSSGRGLFLFNPPLLLGLWCLARPQDRWRPEQVFSVSAAATMVLFYASFRCWPADWGDWGPRYLYPLVPLLLLPVAMVGPSLSGPAFRRAALLLGLAGVLVQMPGVLLRPGAYQWPLRLAKKEGASLDPTDSYFWPQFSPVFLGYRLLSVKGVSALTGEAPQITIRTWDANSVVRSATIPLDAEMLRNSDFVSHVLFSLRQGSFRHAHEGLAQRAWALRVVQGCVFMAGILLLAWGGGGWGGRPSGRARHRAGKPRPEAPSRPARSLRPGGICRSGG
jgi:hypothetical protein